MKKNKTIQLFASDLDEATKEIISEYKNVTIESTSYTKKIITTEGVNYLFCSDHIGKNTFIANQKIKTDLKNGNFVPFEAPKQINYFGFNQNIDFNQKELICVDINSAYPTELKRQNFITDETYKYLTTNIDKIDRLRSLGMLATVKIIEEVKNQKLMSINLKEKETGCVFFQTSFNIGELLNEIFLSYPNYCFFYWVDGIFIKPELQNLVTDYFAQHGFEYKIENIENLQVKNNKYLTYQKEDKKKILFLPQEKRRVSQTVWDFIN